MCAAQALEAPKPVVDALCRWIQELERDVRRSANVHHNILELERD